MDDNPTPKRPIVAPRRYPIIAATGRVYVPPPRDERGTTPASSRDEDAQRHDAAVERAGRSSDGCDATPQREKPVETKEPDPAEKVLAEIFTEFAKRRKREKVGAWAWLQSALAEHAHVLCPSAVSLKDLIAATANIEDMLKDRDVIEGQTPSEYLADWLSGKDKKVVTQ